MIDEQNAVTETLDEKRKRLQRERTRKYRQNRAEQSSPKIHIEAGWKANLAALSVDERKKLNDHIEDWNYIFDVCCDTSSQIRNNAEYGSTEFGLPHRPEEYFAEIEAFAKQFPPTDGLESFKTFFENIDTRRIQDEPFYFRTYGIGVDNIDHIAYYDFLHCFGQWYIQHRNTLSLATIDEYSQSWEQVENLMRQNPRLKNLVGRAKPPLT